MCVFQKSLFAFCILALDVSFLFAQIPPDAGILLQEKRQQVPKLPDTMPAQQDNVPKPALIDTGVRVFVKSFRFTGYEGLATEEELRQIVRGYEGKELGFLELQACAAAITGYLRENRKYLLATAYIPKQDITEGVVTIAILPGRLDGAVGIDLKDPYRVKPSLLEGIASRAIPEDKPIRMEDIERATLIINDLPGIAAHAFLMPGASPGTTRVSIDASEGPLLRGLISGDNFGDRYTGTYRATGQASVNDPFGLADQLSLSWSHAERQDQWGAGYSAPLGSTGLNLTASYTGLTYRIGKDLSDLDAKGWADIFSSGVSYPLVKTRDTSVVLGGAVEYMTLVDNAFSEKTADRAIWDANMSVTANILDTFGGAGMTSALIALTGGNVDLSGLNSYKQLDAAGPGTEGSFIRTTYYVARLQHITKHVSFFGSLRGQFAAQNLDSSQKFILGGPYGVRAYPVGEAPGDEGHSITLETRYDVPFLPSFFVTQLVGFFDAGWIKRHHSTWPGSTSTASGENEYILSGAGIGVNVGKPGVYSLRASYAFKIGPNKGRSLSGNDADGLSDDGRLWLQLVFWR